MRSLKSSGPSAAAGAPNCATPETVIEGPGPEIVEHARLVAARILEPEFIEQLRAEYRNQLRLPVWMLSLKSIERSSVFSPPPMLFGELLVKSV